MLVYFNNYYLCEVEDMFLITFTQVELWPVSFAKMVKCCSFLDDECSAGHNRLEPAGGENSMFSLSLYLP